MRPLNNDEFKELDAELGAFGRGIYYLINAFAEKDDHPNWSHGVKMKGWTLAYNNDGDLVFLKTDGYFYGYFVANRAPGGANFWLEGFLVKSRESDYKFNVMSMPQGKLSNGCDCDRDQMVEWARRWNGYEVTGEEKEYYMALIKAAQEGLEREGLEYDAYKLKKTPWD